MIPPESRSHEPIDSLSETEQRFNPLGPNLVNRSLKSEFESEWLTSSEAAAYLRISEPTLLNMASNGKIKYYKFGRRNRYLRDDLKKLLLAQPRGVFNGS
jgi:excisionase family DNA binding protein